MPQLNISAIRSNNRPVTQAISRDLYERGAAGLLFRSNQDDKPCVVLIEGRGRFVADGAPLSLAEDLPDLRLVCAEYNLVLKSAGTARARTLPAIWRP